MIRFVVPAVPIAQPRAHPAGVGGKTHMFGAPLKHPIHAFRAMVALAAREAYSGPPLEGPLRLDLEVVLPRPKHLRWKTKPMPRIRHIIRPDAKNLLWGVEDALNGILWVDDSQLVVCVEKWIAAGDEQPHVVVQVLELVLEVVE